MEPLSSFATMPEEKTSSLLGRMVDELNGDDIEVEQVLEMLRRRSFGGLFLLLAILSLVPGVSFFAGMLVILPAVQMALGMPVPRFPQVIRQYRISLAQFSKQVTRLMPWIQRIERYVKPRWTNITRVPSPNLLGILIASLGLVIMIPLPFSNFPPALSMFIIALGLLEKDGVMIVVGTALSLVALWIGYVVSFIAIESISLLLK